MAYLVLARKYRPQGFDQVVHQEHVTRTLANAIRAGRLAHAILFAGPRGTGKTTVARILAKAMNCAEGPTPEPCNRCRSCREITGGSASDVYEIDGASNNGVEQVRELRENLKYMPTHSPYKIYIIDEVHMLSVPAFNALLKTLEEPPAHVLFFFATTEPHKIPPTILSRCQRHDLQRVPSRVIAAHLEALCRQEAQEVPAESLAAIAREADGCLRDAMSLLDQVLAAADGQIDPGELLDTLGILDRRRVTALADAIVQRDLAFALETVAAVYEQGADLKKFYQDLCEQFRHMLVVRSVSEPQTLVDLPEAEIEAIGRQVAGLSAARLSQTLDVLLREDAFVRLAPQPRLALETVLVRLLQVPPPLTIDLLVDKLDRLRENGALAAAGPGPPTAPSSLEPPSQPRTGVAGPPSGEPLASPAVSDARPPEAGPLPEGGGAPAGDDPQSRLFVRIQQQFPKLAGVLPLCRLTSVDDAGVVLEVCGNGFQAGLMRRHREALQAICREVLGRDLPLTLDVTTDAPAEVPGQRKDRNRLKQEALNHPLVAEALEIFDGRVVDVRILEGEDK